MAPRFISSHLFHLGGSIHMSITFGEKCGSKWGPYHHDLQGTVVLMGLLAFMNRADKRRLQQKEWGKI